MEIILKDEIVILDEAHNMEDSARDAASYSVTHSELEDGLVDIDYVLKYNVKPIAHTALRNVVGANKYTHKLICMNLFVFPLYLPLLE